MLLENKNELLKEFQLLNTVEEKIEFWEKKLNKNYYFYARSFSSYLDKKYLAGYKDFHEFKIEPINTTEIELINQYLLYFRGPLISKGGLESRNGFDFDILCKELEIKLSNSSNRIGVLEIELSFLESLINKLSTPDADSFLNANDFFISGYKGYYIERKEIDLTIRVAYDLENLLAQYDGYNIAKYKLYLLSEIEKLKGIKVQKTNSVRTKEEMSIAHKLLIFHYLGYLNVYKFNDNKNKAFLYSLLFNTEGDENIRRNLSNVGGKNSTLLTEKNLEYICELFEKLKLKDLLVMAQKDLEKVKKSKPE